MLQPITLCPSTERVSNGEHKHLCPGCGTCWKHADAMQNCTFSNFIAGHTCPTCGEDVRAKYWTSEDVQLMSAHDVDEVRVIFTNHTMRDVERDFLRALAAAYLGDTPCL